MQSDCLKLYFIALVWVYLCNRTDAQSSRKPPDEPPRTWRPASIRSRGHVVCGGVSIEFRNKDNQRITGLSYVYNRTRGMCIMIAFHGFAFILAKRCIGGLGEGARGWGRGLGRAWGCVCSALYEKNVRVKTSCIPLLRDVYFLYILRGPC